MKDGKKLGLTIFQVVLSIILIALIIFSVGVNFIFSSSTKSGEVFGKNIYVLANDSMNSDEGIPNGAAVICDKDIAVLTEGNVILFKENKDVETIMRIVEVVHNTDSTVYRVASDSAPDKIFDVQKENVVAKCVIQNKMLGKVIVFLKSMMGIIVGMIVPCLILIFMLILKIFSARRREREEDEIIYPETSFGIRNNGSENRDPASNPLFDPSMAPKPDASFEMKKSSIAENFSMKPAAKRNIQVSVNDRNMQTESAVEKFKAAVDEKPSAPVSRKASLAPDAANAQREEKLAAIKAALNNNNEKSQQQESNNAAAEKTTVFKAPDAAENRSQPQPVKSAAAPTPAPAPKPAVRKEDNIKSIEDLIKALEEEKKKL